MSAHRFFDPLSGTYVSLVIGPDSHTTGVAHPPCSELAPVAAGLDSAYCSICHWQCRISGAWFVEMSSRESAAATGDEQ